MTLEEVNEMLMHQLKVALISLKLAGVEYVAVVDGRPKPWPAGTPLVVAQREAAAWGVELIDFSTTDGQVKVGEAFLRDQLRIYESGVAETVAAGAAKA